MLKGTQKMFEIEQNWRQHMSEILTFNYNNKILITLIYPVVKFCNSFNVKEFQKILRNRSL